MTGAGEVTDNARLGRFELHVDGEHLERHPELGDLVRSG